MVREKFVKSLVKKYLPDWKTKFNLVGSAGYSKRETKTLHFHKGYVHVLPKQELIWLTKHEIAHAKTPHPKFTPAHSQEFYKSLRQIGMLRTSDERLTYRLPNYREAVEKIKLPKKVIWGN